MWCREVLVLSVHSLLLVGERIEANCLKEVLCSFGQELPHLPLDRRLLHVRADGSGPQEVTLPAGEVEEEMKLRISYDMVLTRSRKMEALLPQDYIKTTPERSSTR